MALGGVRVCVTVPSATHGVGSTPLWSDVCRQILCRGFRQLVSQLWAQSRNLVTCVGSGTRWARRAAQGNLPHPEQTRTAQPPPRALAAWHISLLSTACQKNSLAAWRRARLSRQHIHNTPPPPGKLSLKSMQTNHDAFPVSPRHPDATHHAGRGGLLLLPRAGAAHAWPKHPAPISLSYPISPAPSEAEREGLSSGVLGESVDLGQDQASRCSSIGSGNRVQMARLFPIRWAGADASSQSQALVLFAPEHLPGQEHRFLPAGMPKDSWE